MNNYNDLVDLFKKSSKITVFTGAGISVNSGIPDFRGENGLYSFVKQKYHLPTPEAIFDISYFRKNPTPFFHLTKDLIGSSINPTIAHNFIAWLEEIGKVNLVMTQNIDMLHTKAGSKNVMECHGTYKSAHCMDCKAAYGFDEIKTTLENGEVCKCRCGGVIKPDIVFFGEELPRKFYDLYFKPPEADMLFVIGSSLTVQPAANFALNLAEKVPSVLLNFSKTAYDDYFTHVINDDADRVCQILWDRLK